MPLKPEKGIGYCEGTKYNNSKKAHFKNTKAYKHLFLVKMFICFCSKRAFA
jgi:hypothetical protein